MTHDGHEVIRRILERNELEMFVDGLLASFSFREDFEPLRAPREDLRRWVRWNIDLVIRWLRDGLPPTAAELDRFRELGHTCATDGTPADTILTNYRLGARFAWDALLGAATGEERSALVESAGLMLDFVDLVSRAFSEGYEKAAREGVDHDEERAAQGILGRLQRGEGLLAEDHRFAEQIGFDLDGPYRPFVVMSPGRSAAQHAALARRLRSQRSLAMSSRRSVVGITNAEPDWHRADAGPDAVFSIGDITVRRTLAEALDELCTFVEIAAARAHVGEVTLDDHQADVLLHLSPKVARRLATRVYGPIEAEDPELARTLDSFVEHDFDHAKTAASLPVHRNTLTNRLNRIQAISGLHFGEAEGLALAWLAWLERTRHPGNGERVSRYPRVPR